MEAHDARHPSAVQFVVDESAVFTLNGAETRFDGTASGGHWANIIDVDPFYGAFVAGSNVIRIELTNVGGAVRCWDPNRGRWIPGRQNPI